MSTAFRCDICGDCIDTLQETKNKWIVATVNSTIAGTPVEVSIGLTMAFEHVCEACRVSAKNIAEEWLRNHL